MQISVRQAVSPAEAKGYDTTQLREQFMIEDLFASGELRMTYSHIDRTIVGGVVPAGGKIDLPAPKPVGNPNFCDNREIGIMCIEGTGAITLGDTRHDMQVTDCLYVPRGIETVTFEGADARFYFVSCPAHHTYAAKRISQGDAIRHDLGDQADGNVRTLWQYIHPDVVDSCQLVMGMTSIALGSAWNTMPSHIHDRRSEIYLYFNMAEKTRVFHFMGQPDETRHMVLAHEQAILSPGWSIHCGAGTGPYSFVWSMAGENKDFTDMDFIPMEDLR